MCSGSRTCRPGRRPCQSQERELREVAASILCLPAC
uniref:Uncharacterized protein n=1 Tax=Zea mays TaxID=4577 RepID=B6U040_MAIZE|nr:hypothetical protein [Zea mays]